MDYCDIDWFALEMNRDHSVIFEIASKYYISDSLVDYDGYSIIAVHDSSHELLIAKFRLKLKKVGKTIRPFRYDLSQIP